jgi:amino acid transporter
VFFAFIGFDAVSTAAQEARKPQRDMPIGIIGSLAICTILYVLFAHVLTGMVNYKIFKGDASPVATVIKQFPSAALQITIVIGIIAGYSSVILVMLLGQSRVFFSMSRDGLLPKVFSDVHKKFRTPWRCNLIFMAFVSLFSGFLPISKLGHMTSIGTLLAFVIVCMGIMVMRHTRPDDVETWYRLVIWLVIGLCIYFFYSRHHSHLAISRGHSAPAPGGNPTVAIAATLGVLLGGYVGFLLRPAALIGQLPFKTVILRGANLGGIDRLLVPVAQTSFNAMVAGAIVGAAVGSVIGYLKLGRHRDRDA